MTEFKPLLATDIHGPDVLKQFINAAKFYIVRCRVMGRRHDRQDARRDVDPGGGRFRRLWMERIVGMTDPTFASSSRIPATTRTTRAR
jgi:hypothetical protein